MGLFTECEGDVAILIQKGVYKQVPLYMRNGYYYAKLGSGFIKLHADGTTTHPTTRLDTITVERIPSLGVDPLGRLCDRDAITNSREITSEKIQKLLGTESE